LLNIFNQKEVKKEAIFYNDVPIVKKTDDEFQFYQIAELLKSAIDNASKAMHICLTGQWGSGKSTVLSLLEQMYINETNVKFVTISVWKFAESSTSLQRKILRELETKFGVEINEGFEKTKSEMESQTTTGIFAPMFLFLIKQKSFWIPTLIASLIMIAAGIFTQPLLGKSLTAISQSIYVLTLVSLIAKSNLTLGKTITYNDLPLSHGDQFESRFEKLLKNHSKKYKKLIIVFDDMDRLPHNQLYASLNTIRTFLRMKNCTFIVPCDEIILREEIKEALKEDEQIIKSEDRITEFLNKTFDLMIKLPLVEQRNMRTYAKNLLEIKPTNWFKEHTKLANNLLSILIHYNVTTPRQVKKILNSFTADWELAKRRDLENNIVFLTKNPIELAIFTVLKTDFPQFFDEMKKDTAIFRNKKTVDDFQQDKWFPRPFISKVLKYIPMDIRPFLYFHNSGLNPITGRLQLIDTRDSLINGDKLTFNTKFENLNDEEKTIVLESVIEEFSNEIEKDNIMEIIFSNSKFSKFISYSTRQDWEHLFEQNINHIISYPKDTVLEIFENVVDSLVIWEKLGLELIEDYSDEKKVDIESTLELFHMWIEFPSIVDKLKIHEKLINNIQTYSFEIGMEKENNPYYVLEVINKLQKPHSILNTDNWVDTLIKCIKKAISFVDNDKNEVEAQERDYSLAMLPINLSNWLENVEQNTDQNINIKQIEEIINMYKFLDETSFENFDEYILDKFIDNEKPVKLISIFKLFSEYQMFKLVENSALNRLKTFLLNYNLTDKSLNDIKQILLETWNYDKEDSLRVIKQLSSLKVVADFVLDIYQFGTGDHDEELKKLILSMDKNIDIELLYSTARKHNINSDLNVQDNLLSIFEESKSITENFAKVYPNEFNINKFESIIYNPTDEHYKSKFKLSLFPNRGNVNYLNPLENEIKDLVREQSNYLYSGAYSFRNSWSTALNSLFDIYLEELQNFSKFDWFEIFKEMNESPSILNSLQSNTLESFITIASKNISLEKVEFNEFLLMQANYNHSLHLEAIAKRFFDYSLAQQETILKKITTLDSKRYDVFYKELKKQVKLNKDFNVIDKLAELDFNKNEKEELVNIIIEETNIDKLNNWFNNQLANTSQKPHILVRNAIRYILENKFDIKIFNIDNVRDWLSFSDDRTNIALLIILNLIEKEQAEMMKDKIKNLYTLDDYDEVAEQVLKKYSWRKPKLTNSK
jgi:energy-coupling factor transporter ATP-binding protein EcfA2